MPVEERIVDVARRALRLRNVVEDEVPPMLAGGDVGIDRSVESDLGRHQHVGVIECPIGLLNK